MPQEAVRTSSMSDIVSPLTGTDRVSSRPDIVRGQIGPLRGQEHTPLPLVAGGKCVVFCGTVYKALGTGTSALSISSFLRAS